MKKSNGRHISGPGKPSRRAKGPAVARARQEKRGVASKRPPSSRTADALRRLADAAPLLLWTADPSGAFRFLNEAWKELTGRSTATLRGTGWLDLVHPEQRESARDLYRKSCDAGRPFRAEVRLRDAAGAYRLMQLDAIPLRSNGHIDGYVGSGKDISPCREEQRAGDESESRFRDFADSLGHCFCAVDRDMRLTSWNRACEKTTGLAEPDVIGRRVDHIYPEFPATVLPSYLEKAIVGQQASTFEYELRREESILPLEVTIYPTRSGASVVARDISERRDAERALRVSEAKYRDIFENANDAILIFEPRTERILEANAKAMEMYGFSREEFIGMSLKKLTMDIVRGEQQVAQTLSAGSHADFETVQFRKDGSPLTLVVNSAVIEYCGAPAILSINRDVSHILSVEEVLRGKDNILQRLLASSDDIVSMQDKEGRYLFYNGSPRFNLRTEEVRGRNPYDFFSPAVGRKMMERVYQVISTGKSLSAETQMDWQGETFWFLDQLSPVRNAQGEVVSVVTISRNISDRKRAEEKLRRSEERYRAFIDRSSDGIWRLELLRPIDASLPVEEQIEMLFEYGYLAECNQAMARMLGHTSSDSLIGTPIGTIIPRDNPRTVEGLARFLTSGYQLEESETREIDAEGNVRYFTNGFTGILGEGCLVRIWGSRRDVTERKQVERQMRLLAQTITSTKDCVWIADLDERILFINTAFLSTYGYAEEELLGQPLAVLRSPLMPPDAPRQILPATLHGGWYGEVLHRRKDGRDFPLELWTSVVKNDEAEPVALVGVARDISDRKRMEEALRQSEARLRRIADAMRDVVTQVDREGIMQYVSPSVEQVLGYRPDETLGRSLFDRDHPDERALVADVLRQAEGGGEGVTLEFRYHHAGGHYIWLEAVGSLLFDEHHTVVGAVLGIRDISERKNADDRIRASLREKEVMLKEIHHRVKNNLQVISSLLSLQSEHVPDERVRRVLRDSQSRVRSMAIIHQRLYQSTNLAEINFADYIEELCSQLFRTYGAFGKNIQLATKADEIFLEVDKAIPCGIILNELVSNALKYAFPGDGRGTVTIEFCQEGSEIRLVVRDDGVGMPQDLELRSAESLGLRLVNMLTEQIAGSVTVGEGNHTQQPNRGTRWEVRFRK
jgi:PAS domain S-box-containing protein